MRPTKNHRLDLSRASVNLLDEAYHYPYHLGYVEHQERSCPRETLLLATHEHDQGTVPGRYQRMRRADLGTPL